MVHPAGIAQLVEHDLAKVGVEGPSPFSRSKKEKPPTKVVFFFIVELDEDPRPLGGEGVTKQRDARSAYELFRNYRVAISQALPPEQVRGRL